MPNKDFYNKKDIPQFQDEVCNKTCIMNGRCVQNGKDDHWFLMCPHYFNWKIGFKSFIAEQLEWEREHPEEVAERQKKNLEIMKQIKSSRKTNKKRNDI